MADNVEEVVVAVEYTKAEEAAMTKGWKPKDKFEGAEHEWVSADEFLRRGELFAKIEEQKKEMQSLKRDLQLLAEHNKKVAEAERSALIEQLEAAKAKAITENEGDRVIQIEKQIAKVEKQEVVPTVANPNFENWVTENKWYQTDSEMHSYADEIGIGYKTMHPNATDAEVYAHVTSRVKRAFPDKFEAPKNTPKAAAVDSGSSGSSDVTTSGNTKKLKVSDLNETEREMYNTFVVKRKVMSAEKYLEQLAAVKRRGN